MTGGGTGGHVNPAIAIANTIKKHEPDSTIAFVGTSRGIENKLVPRHGYEVFHIEIQGLRRSLSWSNVKTAVLTVTSVFKAKKLIKEFKPDVVIGTGGYVCWPVVKAASQMGIPAILHESNAIPGVAVRMLEKSVDKIYVNFDSTSEKLKCPEKAEKVGNPFISELSDETYESAREKLGIKGRYRSFLLSFGGSMGAERVNDEVLKVMKEVTSKMPDVLHMHAAGSIEIEEMTRQFNEAGLDKCPNIKLLEYIYDMPSQMAASDLIICRAGAMTLSEVAIFGKPSILIPSPNVTDNHQYKNAHELEKKGAAVVFEEKNLNGSELSDCVRELLGNREKLDMMKKNVSCFALRDANELIYKGIKELLKNKA